MADIIKTWPAFIPAKTTAEVFNERKPPFAQYYFTLGRGKPKQTIERMWFTYQGRLLGWMPIIRVVCNDGTLPRLNRLDGTESDWQIRKDAWVAICDPPCHRVKARVFHEPFRGWRYFDFDYYFTTPDSRHRL